MTLHADEGRRLGMLTTNSSESFNGLLKSAQGLTVTAMVRMNFMQIVERFVIRTEHAKAILAEGGRWMPKPKIMMEHNRKKCELHKMTEYNHVERVYEDRTSYYEGLGGNLHTVYESTRTCSCASIDYGTALTKSLLYYEAQRSGKLPPNQRVQWRGDSALKDGKDEGIDLTGGYYDAGDNVKFGFPMAFTITMLSWSVIEFEHQLNSKNELKNALNAIKWGTDYFIKAHKEPHVLYGEIGDGNSDHQCWERPEDMTTPRSAYKIDQQHPGSDLAGETATALAAAAIAFSRWDPGYSKQLLTHAKELFDFAKKFPGEYQTSISVAGQFYSSSGYEDELLWAAVWLLKATQDKTYLDYINDKSTSSGGTRSMFSWDDKYVGAQLLIAKDLLEKKFPGKENSLSEFKKNAEEFICNCIQKGDSNVKKSSGGLLWWQPWNNLQYVTAATFVITSYADKLSATKNSLQCTSGKVEPLQLITFVKSQVDYILGENPRKMSYMVGFGTNYPKKIHHRGASIVSIKKDHNPVSCHEGFTLWFDKNAPNPNVLDGAIVGGPDLSDNYNDDRNNFQQAEAATANTAPLVGVLARLAS